jgi:hypothetical protein
MYSFLKKPCFFWFSSDDIKISFICVIKKKTNVDNFVYYIV